MTRIAIIIASTRKTRFADKPAKWIFDLASARDDMEVELVDIRDFDLPFFNEAATNLWTPSTSPNAVRWQKKLAEFDGFVFVTSEYNRSVPASLKNALDQAYKEWVKKPMAVMAYGSVGGAFAADHLRTISIELQMVPIRFGVHVGGRDFMTVHPMGGNEPMSAIEDAILPSAKAMLENLVWWAELTKQGRQADAQAQARAA
jgi:NAD(P)H-dependent FMN reductase